MDGVEHIIRLKEQDKYQITDQEYRGPDNGPSKGTLFIPQVHKVPGDVIGLYKGQDDKDPVEYFHSQKEAVGQCPWLDDPQDHLNGGHDGKEDQYPPYFCDVRTEFQPSPENSQILLV